MTIIYMLLILNLIVSVHEFGHFIFAKKAGIYVYEFSIGMGPRLIKFNRKNDETEYSIRLLPIGGYVQMAGEEIEADEKIPEEKRMQSKTWLQKFTTVIAGIVFNYLLALVLLFVVGLVNGAGQNKPYISSIEENTSAANSTLKEGDKIIKFNGKKVNSVDVLALKIQTMKGETIELEVKDENNNIKKVYLGSTKIEENGKTVERYGIAIGDTYKTGVLASIKYAFVKTINLVEQMCLVIVYLVTGKLGIGSLSGPVGIYGVVGDSASAGFINLVYLTALISVNVGFINLLPLPALDGGRLLFLIIEKIKGKPVDIKIENTVHTVGFVLLMILMLVITASDILKLF